MGTTQTGNRRLPEVSKLPLIALVDDKSGRRHKEVMAEIVTVAALLDLPVKEVLSGISDRSVRTWTELALIHARKAGEGTGGNETLRSMVGLLHTGMKGGPNTYAAVLALLGEMSTRDPESFRDSMQRVSRRVEYMEQKPG